jgi:membrane fusion protein (multidrug efflux system)
MNARTARRAEPETPDAQARRNDRPEGRDEARDDASARSDRGAPTKTSADTAKPQTSRRGLLRRHPYAAAGAALAIVLIVAAAAAWWLQARNYESTDDAYIDARTVTIAPQVTGAIVNVPVSDNQIVPAGGLLAELDPRDYEDAVARAKAQVDQATAQIANLEAQIDAQNDRIDAAKKQVDQAQAALVLSRQENTRAQDLYGRGAGTKQQADQTASDLRQKEASYATAQANEVTAEKQIAILHTQQQGADGQLEQANATLKQAEVNLSRTRVTAPMEGRVTKLSAALGNLGQPGQALMMFVPTRIWITANFKETQLNLMRPGQPVEISVDAYPDRTFHGRVDSIQAGSGAAFSLLPPENATGNFVKVVQRVPVKIVFDGDPGVYLGPGMSVVPTVRIR